MSEFRTAYGENLFNSKYAKFANETWEHRAWELVEYVTGKGPGHFKPILPSDLRYELFLLFRSFMGLPGGRYIWYAGREARFYNNCQTRISKEDTREDWADLLEWSADSLMMGSGVGNNYNVYRGKGTPLRRTGGEASGPLPLIQMVDAQGEGVRQGGGRRAAIYASLNDKHPDIWDFIMAKDWKKQVIGPDGFSHWDAKAHNFNYYAPLQNTNMSVQYFEDLHERGKHEVFVANVKEAMRHGEPGFQFDFNRKDIARNACTEVTSDSWYDVCNLGSPNMANIETKEQFRRACFLMSAFLYCGTIRGVVQPKSKPYRDQNRRLGTGLMGVHEWLLKRGYRYEMNDELRSWMEEYVAGTEEGGNFVADRTGLPRPVAYRAIAPTGTISGLAGTTSGIEPMFATAYKRRWLHGEKRNYQHVVDMCANDLIENYGLKPDDIETSFDLAKDPIRRIKFQADMQDYVDMAISSTINLPEWGSEWNNEDRLGEMVDAIYKYAPRLRGLTFYSDGARPGQPLTPVDYYVAKEHGDVVLEENSMTQCKSGVCGI